MNTFLSIFTLLSALSTHASFTTFPVAQLKKQSADFCETLLMTRDSLESSKYATLDPTEMSADERAVWIDALNEHSSSYGEYLSRRAMAQEHRKAGDLKKALKMEAGAREFFREHSAKWLPKVFRDHASQVILDSNGVLIGLRFAHISDFNQFLEKGGKKVFQERGFHALDLGRLSRVQMEDLEGRVGLELLNELARWEGLTHLSLASRLAGDSAAEILVRNRSLRVLDLSNNGITDQGATALSASRSLTKLNLSWNSGIKVRGIADLAKSTALTDLDLSHLTREIGDEGAEQIKTNRSLISLNFSGNGMTDAGALALATMPNLRKLNIAENLIRDLGAAAFHDSPLTHIDISHNRIGDAGALGLSKTRSLTHLKVVGNPIPANGLAALAQIQGLTHFSVMISSVDGGLGPLPKCTKKTCDKVIEAIQNNKSLTHLNFSFNYLDEGILQKLKLSSVTHLAICTYDSLPMHVLKDLIESGKLKHIELRKEVMFQNELEKLLTVGMKSGLAFFRIFQMTPEIQKFLESNPDAMVVEGILSSWASMPKPFNLDFQPIVD